MKSDKISTIDVDSTDWQDRVYLTLDFDWAANFVLEDTLDLLDEFDVAATFFVTHTTPVLERIRDNPNYELAIHPNFDQNEARSQSFHTVFIKSNFVKHSLYS